MATYYSPAKRKSDDRWDYTASNSRGTHPIGYCAGWHELDPDSLSAYGDHLFQMMKEDQERKRVNKGKYHTDGHATSHEAHTCYKRYQLDNYLLFRENADEQKRCQAVIPNLENPHVQAVCGKWTQGRALIGSEFPTEFCLCSEHSDKQTVEALFIK